MSVTKVYGKFVFVCDSCQTDLETDKDEWQEARAVFKRERWHDYRQRDGSYKHYCDDCEEE